VSDADIVATGDCWREPRWRLPLRLLAQTAAERVKGPLVWMDMDQKALDDAYDQAVYAPNRDIIIKRCIRNSELARERLGPPKRFLVWADLVRGHRRVPRQDAERADHDLCARRLVARGYGVAVPLPRRGVPQRRRQHLLSRTSPMSATSAAACSSWPIRSAGRVAFVYKNASNSAATRSASTYPASHPAAIGLAC